ncbi:hypothetical protein C0075_12135 [Rhizobium sp. KAs_5_22]|uniref:hypothetical protein n=1 Tax=Ciceribacter selenitireducens TaxID=448181 RepID=UPI00048F0057|nr:hypothetical protein [Ciceribacter selenitireducens]PPJ46422.1 hypothetical protein C0075_12135 [Rhizobium sp. KAs_5_22]
MSRNIPSIAGGLFGRIAAPAAAALMLASCQTTAQDSAAQGDAVPMETASAVASKPAPSKKTANGYTDPLVSATAPGTDPAARPSAIPTGDGAIAAYAPAQAPADLGELTQQPTAVNASRNSLFSQAPTTASESPVPAAAETETPAAPQAVAMADSGSDSSTSIVVPSELPTREVNPMRKSLFSAELRQPQPPVVEQAYLPPETAGETPVYAADETPIYEDAAAASQPVAKAEQQVAQTVPAAAMDPAEPEQPKKRKWLESLKAAFGKKKD